MIGFLTAIGGKHLKGREGEGNKTVGLHSTNSSCIGHSVVHYLLSEVSTGNGHHVAGDSEADGPVTQFSVGVHTRKPQPAEQMGKEASDKWGQHTGEEKHRERDRQRQREKTETERETERKRERDRERETERQRQRETKTETDRQRQIDRQTDKDKERERERQRERDRDKERRRQRQRQKQRERAAQYTTLNPECHFRLNKISLGKLKSRLIYTGLAAMNF